ncbi:uncharacterized protein LOC126973411 [Leptidea sinapis]|uniref:uncharacterized protein LOC126973411 n=1 Tax=Leptidea sinapis TaxID=189913 RepID=UPI0021C47688|nr:uncharacterized protein LOC126973411 [Leptidea sinapis]
MPRRCAFGCALRKIPMHRFPDAIKFPEQFKTWVSLVGGNPETSDFDIYKKKRICDIHFSDKHRNRNQRLNTLAVPMLHVPGQVQSQDVILGQASSTKHLLPTIIQQDCSEPYVSNFILEKGSTSTTFQPVPADASQQCVSAKCLMLEHNYSVISKPKRTALKDVMAAQRTKIKHLQAEISRLRRKGQSFKARTVILLANIFISSQLLEGTTEQATTANVTISCVTGMGDSGTCVSREHCDYGTRAIDYTLYARSSFKKYD